MILNFLNKRYSTRNLSDHDFDSIINELAEGLVLVDYCQTYNDDVLYKDWNNLCSFNSSGKASTSTTRIGMKLCEHFFHNFFNIENSNGKSFANQWTKENLVKVLRWNRKSHSTPYLSEIRRGIYFCCGLTKNTMYRPHLAKTIVDDLSINVVLDPCAGWGGRMLGTVSSGKEYIGFEPNIETYNNLLVLADFLNIKSKVTIINDGIENINSYDFKNVDTILTSPPYFNLEIYSKSNSQCENKYDNYDNWKTLWLTDIIQKCLLRLQPNGYSCWNTHNVGKIKLIDDIDKIHNDNNYECVDEYYLSSSRRQAHNKKTKSLDVTRVYKHRGLM